MAPRIRKGNPELVRTLIELRNAAKRHEAPVWGAVAECLARPRHQTQPVNVGHLNRLTVRDETIVVPGKLLASGRLEKPLTVAAFHYSVPARAKIHAAGGTALTIPELIKARPTGAGVRLLG